MSQPTAAPTADYPAYRPYRVRVGEITPLSPSFVRVSFVGDALEHFGVDGLDQRIKLVFPLPGIGLSDIGADEGDGDWYQRWRELPPEQQNPFRTYTVRAIDPVARRLDVDFVRHETEADDSHATQGPAARWLATAAPGDELLISGPDSRSANSHIGIDWRPGRASELLLLGDETAAPAICAILAALPPESRGTALIEVPEAADQLPAPAPAGLSVHWLPRGAAPCGARLVPAVRDWLAEHPEVVAAAGAPLPQPLEDIDVDTEILWDSPDPEASAPGGLYAWLAGESGVIKGLRRTLVTEHGVDRGRVAFMGYWRLGKAERQ